MGEVDQPEEPLFHLSLNDSEPTTIVLLHGVLGSSTEWALVVPLLKGYHLLIPDLPGHSRSSAIGPVDTPSQADRVATLIKAQAHGGRAHVVGMSMGGHVTCQLAARHPDVVSTAFVTGAAPFKGFGRWLASHPTVIWYIVSFLLKWLPNWLFHRLALAQGMKPAPELADEMRANLRWETLRDAFASGTRFSLDDVAQIQVPRVLAVCGGKGDDVDSTREMGLALQGEKCKAVVVRNGVHSWHLQLPDLFAEGVLAWIQEIPLPSKFEEL